MFCTNCGKENAENAKVCSNCGTKFPDANAYLNTSSSKNNTFNSVEEEIYGSAFYAQNKINNTGNNANSSTTAYTNTSNMNTSNTNNSNTYYSNNSNYNNAGSSYYNNAANNTGNANSSYYNNSANNTGNANSSYYNNTVNNTGNTGSSYYDNTVNSTSAQYNSMNQTNAQYYNNGAAGTYSYGTQPVQDTYINGINKSKPQPRFKRPGAGAHVASVFICILAFFCMMYLFFSGFTQYFMSSKGMSQMLSSTSLFEDVDVIDEFFGEEDADLDDILSAQDRKDFDAFYGEILSHFMQFFLTGEGVPIETDTVVEFFEDHEEILEEVYDERISNDDYKALEMMVNEMNKEIMDEYNQEIRNMDSDGKQVLKFIRGMFDKKHVIIPAVILAICILGMAAIFNKNADKTAIFTGVTIIVSSVFMLLIAGGLGGLITMAMEDEPDLANIFGTITKAGTTFAGLYLVFGILLIVAGNIYRKVVVFKPANN